MRRGGLFKQAESKKTERASLALCTDAHIAVCPAASCCSEGSRCSACQAAVLAQPHPPTCNAAASISFPASTPLLVCSVSSSSTDASMEAARPAMAGCRVWKAALLQAASTQARMAVWQLAQRAVCCSCAICLLGGGIKGLASTCTQRKRPTTGQGN